MPAVRLSPEAERRMIDDARERAHLKLLIIGGAVGLVGLITLASLGAAIFMLVARG
jgi:hypothetical protein